MAYEYIKYEKEEGIAKITMNHPQVMNTLSPAVLYEPKRTNGDVIINIHGVYPVGDKDDSSRHYDDKRGFHTQ